MASTRGPLGRRGATSFKLLTIFVSALVSPGALENLFWHNWIFQSFLFEELSELTSHSQSKTPIRNADIWRRKMDRRNSGRLRPAHLLRTHTLVGRPRNTYLRRRKRCRTSSPNQPGHCDTHAMQGPPHQRTRCIWRQDISWGYAKRGPDELVSMGGY